MGNSLPRAGQVYVTEIHGEIQLVEVIKHFVRWKYHDVNKDTSLWEPLHRFGAWDKTLYGEYVTVPFLRFWKRRILRRIQP